MLKRLLNPEMAFTLTLTALGCIVIYMSLKLGIGSMKSPGAGFYPFFVGWFIFLVGAFVTLSSLMGKRPPESSPIVFGKGDLRRLLAMITSFCTWLIFMPLLGFIIMTFVVSFAFAKIMGLKGWLLPGILATSISIFIFLLFDVVFYTDLPRGILG